MPLRVLVAEDQFLLREGLSRLLTDGGLRAAIQIRRAHPEMGVLMLSQFRDEAYALDLIGENARGVGYLLKDRVADVASFTDAVRRVGSGGSVLDPEIVALMVGRRRRHDPLRR